MLALTPGSEGASRHAIKHICDRFAVSDAAKELDMEVHLELHLMNQEDVSYLYICFCLITIFFINKKIYIFWILGRKKRYNTEF